MNPIKNHEIGMNPL